MKIEQRQKYYEHLCELGMPEIIAASMAAQADHLGMAVNSQSKRESLCTFQEWEKTNEGFNFWSCLTASLG